jgi:CDP-glucose 4,6-dehydratase
VSDAWRERTALVTGATGLLGSWLVPILLARGARVVALVRDVVPDSLFYGNGAAAMCVQVHGDVRDGRLVERVLVEHEVDAVFHLAAQTIVEHALRDPTNTFRSNVEGTWELLDACRRSRRPTRIVVASSDKAYGAQLDLPYREDHPLAGTHPYDVSKSCADLIALAYATTYDVPVAVTRCGNLFGGGDLNFNRLVPGVIRDALADRAPVIRSDGTLVRDFLYVEDAAEANVLLAERMDEPGIAGEAWNFSLEERLTAEEMARRVLAAVGKPELELDVRAEAQHELAEQSLSSAKARERLGWTARIGLDTGLERAVTWYRGYLSAPETILARATSSPPGPE